VAIVLIVTINSVTWLWQTLLVIEPHRICLFTRLSNYNLDDSTSCHFSNYSQEDSKICHFNQFF